MTIVILQEPIICNNKNC